MVTPHTTKVDIAGVSVALIGDHPVLDIVRREIPVLTGKDTEPAGSITLVDPAPPRSSAAVGLGPITVDDETIRIDFDRSGLELQFPIPPVDTPFRATVTIRDRPMPYGIPSPLFRWLEPTFLRPAEAQAYAFLHLVLESMTLLGAPVAPLHAAVLERGGRALALTSAGGVGKTTTAMELLASREWRYLSDDMTMLQPGQPVRPYARRPMIYEYNLAHHPGARPATKSSKGISGRIQWALMRPIHGTKRRRRVEVEHLYGRRVVGSAAPLGTVAFLVRHAGSSVEVSEMAPADLARRSTAIIELEFQTLLDGLRLAEAASGRDLVEPLIARCRSIYEDVFTGIGVFQVRVPTGGNASDVARVVEELTSGQAEGESS